MPGFITNTTNITMDNLTYFTNSSSLPEFIIKVNNSIYDGWLFFIVLFTLWIILFFAANKVRDQPLNNIMYAGAAVSILSFLLRGMHVVVEGTRIGMLTDHQLWIFPVLTLICALIVYATKE